MSTTQTITNIIYDIFTAVVSLLDVITDIWVMIEFYNERRMSFFYTSLIILIIAQFAYAIAFWWRFSDSYKSVYSASFGFCCLLPFSPILSFAFYFTGDENSFLFDCLKTFF